MFRGWTVSFAEERNVWWSRFRIENDCQASFTLNMIRENIYTENKDCKYAEERKSAGELQRQIVLIWGKKERHQSNVRVRWRDVFKQDIYKLQEFTLIYLPEFSVHVWMECYPTDCEKKHIAYSMWYFKIL